MARTNSKEWQLSVRGAEAYDQVLVPAIFGPWVSKLLNIARLSPGHSVLDVACGTGIIAEAALAQVGTEGLVVGLDINPAMLQVASGRRGPAVTWTEGDVHRMPFAAWQFDRVICQLGLQYFADQPAALAEMRRVLKPSGELALMVWRSIEHSPGFSLLADLISEHLGPEIGASMRGPFSFGDNEEGLHSLLTGSGFQQVTVKAATGSVHFKSVDDFVFHQLAASPLGSHGNPAGNPWIDSVKAGLISSLGLHKASDAVIFPIEACLAHAQGRGD